MGDQVLKTVTKLIKDSIRGTDLLARYGGEKFVLLMPATTASDAYIVGERTRLLIEGYQFSKLGNVTINNADKALYQAKETGRNKTVIFN